MVLKDKVSRCAIFLFYDKDGIVDDYITFFLEALKSNVDKILVVSNGELSESGREKLNAIVSDILVRENTGMDVGGYKAGVSYLGYEQLSKYDEIILLNYTFFGPLYPLEEMFTKMNQKDLDFWGITSHAKIPFDPFGTIEYGYMPKHIQSYFLVLRNSLFVSKEFQDYWNNLKIPKQYTDSITEFETVFSKKFEDMGFKWEAYIDSDDYKDYAYAPSMYCIKSLIEDKRCPIVKRRSFFHDYKDFFDNTCGEPSVIAYEYIKEHTDYDTSLIWNNILRLENGSDINKAMHLNYFLSSEVASESDDRNTKVAFVLYCSCEKPALQYLKYLKNIPKEYKKYIITDSKELEKQIMDNCEITNDNNLQIIVDEKAVCYEYAVLNTLGDSLLEYELVCLINEAQIEHTKPYSNAFSWLDKTVNNLIPSKEFIENVISTFHNDSYLGLLSPYIPYHGIYFEMLHRAWQESYEKITHILKDLNNNVNTCAQKFPIAPIGGSCWMRPDILKEILHYSNKEELWGTKELAPSLFGFLLPHLAQAQPYYVGWLMNEEYASLEFTNLEYMIRETNKVLFNKLGVGTVYDMTKKINECDGSFKRGRKYYIKQAIKKVLPGKVYLFGKLIYIKFLKRK